MNEYVVTIGKVEFNVAIRLLEKYSFVELRIDLVDWNLSEINSFIKKANRIIVAYRPEVSDLQRLDVLRQLPWESIDYVDIELDNDEKYVEQVLSFIKVESNVRVIWSVHDYVGNLNLKGVFQDFEKHKIKNSILKIAVHCKSEEHAKELLQWYEDKDDLVIIGMGEEGRKTRLEGLSRGAPFMYLAAEEIGPLAPGQFTKVKILRSSDYFIAGVIGRPISHSRSPLLFNSFFKSQNISADYLRFAFDGVEEVSIIKEYLPLSFVNVTSPFKRIISTDKQAYNVWRLEDNAFRNSDVIALEDLIKKENFSSDSRCLVVGYGGAAEAIIRAFDGFDITIAGRDDNKAFELSEAFDLKVLKWGSLVDESNNYDIVGWTIPASVWKERGLSIRDSQFVIDANYKDSLKEIGVEIDDKHLFSGEDWLLGQALPIMKWFAPTPDVDLMQRWFGAQKSFKEKPIVLVGLPASGKSVVGKILAEQLRRDCVDTDEEIEKKEDESIVDIFKIHGEDYFRDCEAEALKGALKSKNVVASGGGIVERASNRAWLKTDAFVVWLCTNPEIAANRISSGERPMFEKHDAQEVMINLHNKRTPLYAEVSDIVICTDNKTPKEIAKRIHEEYNLSE